MPQFDDGRLDDPLVLAEQGAPLRRLALAGARLRQALASADLDALTAVAAGFAPRAIVAIGPEARLIRAVAEPVCPVPLVAWSGTGLPAWVGALDLVIIVGGGRESVNVTLADAVRRGAVVFVLHSTLGPIAEYAVGRSVAAVDTHTEDAFINATVALTGLERLGLAPAIVPDRVSDGLDEVSEACSPHSALGSNPAKDTAVCLGDAIPLIWGGTVLAARAARRLAGAIRQVSHRAALAADAVELWPVLTGCAPPDVFADPFDDPPAGPTYCLVRVDDVCPDVAVTRTGDELVELAEGHGVRIARLSYGQGTAFQRYACLLQHGRFAAAYLDLGLG